MKQYFILFLSSIILMSCSHNDDRPILKFFSWNDYYDTSIIKEFEDENHVKVQIDYFANNEEALAKIEQQISSNKNIDFDVFFPSDYLVEYLKNKNMLEKLDIQNMPHIKNNILPQLKTPIDVNHEYSVPYAWGSIGILYNSRIIKQNIKNWEFILKPAPEYKGKILMIDSPQELLGIALKYLGYSFNDHNINHLKQAGQILKEQSNFVLNYNGDAIQESLPNEEAYLAVAWSAEARFAMQKNPDLRFVIPQEGSNIWTDNLVILKGTQQKALAEKFIDFWYRDDIMKKNWDYMHMSVPSISFFKTLPKEEQENKMFYPQGAFLKKLDFNRDIDSKTRTIITDIYTNIRS